MACGGDGVIAVQDVLVVRPEYVWLEETIESGYLASANAVMVTGQPGIGKTVFLLYLLLSRLRRQLPTVIQLSSSMIVAFNDRGVFVEPSDTFMNLRGYLALMDSNSDSVSPSPAVQWSQPRIIQAAPPETNKWGRWAKESSAEVVISALPTPLEIGAVVKASGLDYAQVGRLVKKWGPCTRTIIELIGGDGTLASREQALFTKAELAAVNARQHTDTKFSAMDPLQRAHSVGTTLAFIHPRRPRDPVTSTILHSASCFSYIPSTYLLGIFNQELRKPVNDNPCPFSVQDPDSVFQSLGSERRFKYHIVPWSVSMEQTSGHGV
ncbi:hypothetical protein LXA43DRAFT_1030045 [Ganoderma leucocontextum]|nr:hypothetical protein LXA43DRAFT_1030045 [Ganoderma leucocontextum]